MATVNPPAPQVSQVVANIALEVAYDVLGMKAKYKEAVKLFDMSEDQNLWKLLMLQGVTFQLLEQGHKKLGLTLYTYGVDLDKALADDFKAKRREKGWCNDRNSDRDGMYMIPFLRNVEADPENANQCARNRRAQELLDITAQERVLMGMGYSAVTKEHLDVENWTLCAGSCASDGRIPRVDSNLGYREVSVRWDCPGDARPNLRARCAVSLPTKPSEAQA